MQPTLTWPRKSDQQNRRVRMRTSDLQSTNNIFLIFGFSAEMSNNIRHRWPQCWNPTEASPTSSMAMSSVWHFHRRLKAIAAWAHHQVVNQRQWVILDLNSTPEDAARCLGHEWAYQRHKFQGCQLQAGCAPSSPVLTPEGTKGESFWPTEWGQGRQFCLLLQGRKITDGKGWDEDRKRGRERRIT